MLMCGSGSVVLAMRQIGDRLSDDRIEWMCNGFPCPICTMLKVKLQASLIARYHVQVVPMVQETARPRFLTDGGNTNNLVLP